MNAADRVGDVRDDALRIWHAGVKSVDSSELVRKHLRVEGSDFCVGDVRIKLRNVRRVAVIGGGKAGAGMAAAIEEILPANVLGNTKLTGWINVPNDCVRNLPRIHLHGARPAGVNEPTEEGILGTRQIAQIARSLSQDDICLCLLSGGGSALLPAPARGITLADKLAVTKFLSEAGASINELNTVRKHLSEIKGGGLARICKAGQLITLIISDVLGDPLDIISSGPTVVDPSTSDDALDILNQFHAKAGGISSRVFDSLRHQRHSSNQVPTEKIHNLVIGNNQTAVQQAAEFAKQLGYRTETFSASHSEGFANDIGRELGERLVKLDNRTSSRCLVHGGEPVVKLVSENERGKGGRNQQLALAALDFLMPCRCENTALLSGGTDGEDGPTDAAGAIVDAHVVSKVQERRLEPSQFLAKNDAYHFFEQCEGLVKTGPTHTNVCDLRILIRRI